MAKKPKRSLGALSGSDATCAERQHFESMDGIPDFTPEQWSWLLEQARPFENGYVPTRSLIAGL
jgi:hypothetical protein